MMQLKVISSSAEWIRLAAGNPVLTVVADTENSFSVLQSKLTVFLFGVLTDLCLQGIVSAMLGRYLRKDLSG